MKMKAGQFDGIRLNFCCPSSNHKVPLFANFPFVAVVTCRFCTLCTFLSRGRNDILLRLVSFLQYSRSIFISITYCKFLVD